MQFAISRADKEFISVSSPSVKCGHHCRTFHCTFEVKLRSQSNYQSEHWHEARWQASLCRRDKQKRYFSRGKKWPAYSCIFDLMNLFWFYQSSWSLSTADMASMWGFPVLAGWVDRTPHWGSCAVSYHCSCLTHSGTWGRDVTNATDNNPVQQQIVAIFIFFKLFFTYAFTKL